jgi:hypothetical protein
MLTVTLNTVRCCFYFPDGPMDLRIIKQSLIYGSSFCQQLKLSLDDHRCFGLWVRFFRGLESNPQDTVVDLKSPQQSVISNNWKAARTIVLTRHHSVSPSLAMRMACLLGVERFVTWLVQTWLIKLSSKAASKAM